MAKQSILVVISNEMDRKTLVEHLALVDEFNILESSSSSECIGRIKSEPVKLLLIDDEMPEGDISSLKAIGKLRENGFAEPIYLLSSQCSDSDVLQCLKSGSNDVIGKPVNHPLLIEKIRIQFSQNNRNDAASLKVGGFVFHPDLRCLVEKDGKRTGLSPKESDVLKILCKFRQTTVSRGYLLQEVWGLTSDTKTNTLAALIWKLRQNIEKDPRNPTLLLTIGNGKGYMLNS